MARRKHPATSMSFNMTPMIDIVFQLNIFFLLATQVVSAENKPVELPEPQESIFNADLINKLENRVVVQVTYADVNDPSSEIRYYYGPRRITDMKTLAQELAARKALVPDLAVVIRADKRIEYEKIRDVMVSLATANIPNMYLAAVTKMEEVKPPEE